MVRSIKLIISLFITCLCLHGCKSDDGVNVLRIGHTLDTEHSVHKAMVHMSERLRHYSDGKMDLKIYPSAQLGNEREMVELLQIGSLALTKVSAATIEGFVPEMKIYGIPYIFRNRAHRWKVLQGSIGSDLLNETEKAHIVGLGYYDSGSRSFYMTDTRVEHPSDLTSKKIRVMESATAKKMVSSFGGSSTPISFGELYAALQQGVVDGAENNPPSFYLSRHYEICKYYTLDEHTSVPDVIVASKHVMDNLTPEQQQWLKQAVADSVEVQKDLWLASETHALNEVKKAGVEVIIPDKQPYIDAVKPMHEELKGSKVGGYLDRIKQAALEL
ncbi:TRAP transporter substrate-binding protein [Catenovulum maritimum]|uniref:C4-dicarboxylate ABC transporter substrate-binding protein n=1 Tax=Catenovulum maritimum TaxID=1513271 RepID=A0A0J8GR95_9ALTE|nr:TRAP transporter substrate-binding protein [Catenovulum maritimum]KMT63749.1 C4-dicarboxylate ABC transporter substrate-binding protein [Catenovulum maritimum]